MSVIGLTLLSTSLLTVGTPFAYVIGGEGGGGSYYGTEVKVDEKSDNNVVEVDYLYKYYEYSDKVIFNNSCDEELEGSFVAKPSYGGATISASASKSATISATYEVTESFTTSFAKDSLKMSSEISTSYTASVGAIFGAGVSYEITEDEPGNQFNICAVGEYKRYIIAVYEQEFKPFGQGKYYYVDSIYGFYPTGYGVAKVYRTDVNDDWEWA